MSNEEHGTVTTSDEPTTATCPVLNAAHQAVGITANQHWWPHSLNLRVLRQHHPEANHGRDFATPESRASTSSPSERRRSLRTQCRSVAGEYGH